MCGPIVVAQFYSNHVGSGSESHCFVEDEPMAMRTSSTVTDSRSDHVDIVLFVYDGLSARFGRSTDVCGLLVNDVMVLFRGETRFCHRFVFAQQRVHVPPDTTVAADLISVFQYDDAFFLASLRLERSDVLQAASDSAFLLIFCICALAGVPFPSQSDTPRRTTVDDDVHGLGMQILVLIHPAVLWWPRWTAHPCDPHRFAFRWDCTTLIPEVCWWICRFENSPWTAADLGVD